MRRARALIASILLIGALVAPHGASARLSRVPARDLPTRWPIKHVIFIVKENRTFDQMFAAFPGIDAPPTDAQGHFLAKEDGRMRRMTQVTLQALPDDPHHSFKIWLESWHHGLMDGFNVDALADRYAFTYLTEDQIPNYWTWAEDFVLSDRFFASAAGPSFPNHLFTIAAQAARTHYNPWAKGRVDPSRRITWGCDAPKGVIVHRLSRRGSWIDVPPCFDLHTLGDLLTASGIGWRYYSAVPPLHGYVWSSYDAIRHIRDTAEWRRHVRSARDLLDDIRDVRLPPVTWITPTSPLSEHPEFNLCYGENWTTRVVDAVMRSSIWKNTAIFITWDDWGGYYDHVPPPATPDRWGLGFRVPLLVISPYALQGAVDHRLGDFSSVLRFIEDNWRLGRLNGHDRGAGNLSYDFAFTAPPRSPEPLPQRTDCQGPLRPAGAKLFDPD